MSFFAELKRRNVVRVGIAYVVGGWLLLQLTEVLSELLKLPDEIGPIVVAIVAIGLPIALFFAWAYELTPEGVKRESDVDRSQSVAPKTGRKLDFVIIGMLALGLAYFFWESRLSDRDAVESDRVALEQTPSAPNQPQAEPEPTISPQSVAVLPFENRSRLEEDEFFVVGIHDDLLTSLARIGSLKVISRTSVNKYKETAKTIPEIAAELGVATVMEGAVQRAGDTVRINVQLIDANTDEHLWAEIFDRQLTTQNLFAIQSEISTAIAQALEATLSPQEQDRLQDIPTDNIDAYNAYVRARQFMSRRNADDLQAAAREFERAVELDPGYALAWVGAADVYSLLAQYSDAVPAEMSQRAEIAVQQALNIDDNLGEAYIALAGNLNDRGQNAEADEAFQKGIALSPNYVSGHHWYATFLTTRIDRQDAAVQHINKAAELDPLSSIILANRVDVLTNKGDFDAADQQLLRLTQSDPDFAPTYIRLGGFPFTGRVPLDEAIPNLRKARQLDPGNPLYPWLEASSQVSLGNLAEAERIRAELEDVSPGHYTIGSIDSFLNMYRGNMPGAVEAQMWASQKAGNGFGARMALMNAKIMARDYPGARKELLAISPELEAPGQWAEWIAYNANNSCAAAWVFLQTGDEQMGQEFLAQATDFLINEAPLHMQHPEVLPASSCLLMQGKIDAALDQLEKNFNLGYSIFTWRTEKLPWFAQISDEPRFQALLAKVDTERQQQRERLAKLDAEAGL